MIATPNMRHTPTSSSTSGFHPSTSQCKDSKREKSTNNNVLYLEKSPIQFKSPSTNLNLYLDECNKEIISISRNQELGVTIVEIQPILGRARLISLKLPIKKKILSLKFSPDRSVLAYHIEHNVLEFINLKKESDQAYSLGSKHYVRSCSAKNSKFYGFFWVGQIEIVIVTNISVEYYHVEPAKHRLKHIKTFSLSTNWFIHQPNHSMFEGSHRDSILGRKDYSVLMVSFGLGGSDVQPFVFQERDMQKMISFEVEGNWRDSDQLEQSVTISRVYGEVRLLVLQHGATHNMKIKGSRILVYTLNLKTRLTSRTHILDFDTSGYFALNVVDDIIIGHHQASKTSFMFDILAKSTEMSDCPNQFVSLNNRQSIRPLYLEDTKQNAELYSPNWVFIQPDFIINPQVGHLMILKLDLTLVSKLFYDNNVLIDFLTYRRKSESILFEKCKHVMDECYQAISGNSDNDAAHKSLSSGLKTCPLIDVSLMLEIANRITKSASTKTNANKPRDQSEESSTMKVAINQEEFYQNVFKSFVEKASSQGLDSLTAAASLQFAVSSILEYIFVIRNSNKNVSSYVYEQLALLLIRHAHFYQLVCMIRAKIFQDSKQMASLLLKLSGHYAPAKQLGRDMLSRLNVTIEDDVVERLSGSSLNQRITGTDLRETSSNANYSILQRTDTELSDHYLF